MPGGTTAVSVKALDGTVVGQRVISQKPATFYWMNLALIPETANRIGTFVVEVVQQHSTTVSGFSLQLTPSGAFSVITPFEQ